MPTKSRRGNDTNQIQPVLHARGCQIQAASDSRIACDQGGEVVVRVHRLRLHEDEADERWDPTAAGPRRESLDILVTRVSAPKSDKTFVTIEAWSIDASSPGLEAKTREVEELGREGSAGRGVILRASRASPRRSSG